MINTIKRIAHLGPYDEVVNLELGRINLVYAGNGKGKTKLAESLRTMAEDQRTQLAAHKRLKQGVSSDHEPTVELDWGTPPMAIRWSPAGLDGDAPEIAVYNDVFVRANVADGSPGTPTQRQDRFSVIIAEHNIRLQKQYDSAKGKRDEWRDRQESLENQLGPALGLPGGNQLSDFCRATIPDDLQDQWDRNQRLLNRAANHEVIGALQPLVPLPTPTIDLSTIKSILKTASTQISASALRAWLEDHFQPLGTGGEKWSRHGWEHRDTGRNTCPFCRQDLPADIINNFRAYFDKEYGDRQDAVTQFLHQFKSTHSAENRYRTLNSAVKVNRERCSQWSQLIPDLIPSLSSVRYFNTNSFENQWGLVADPIIEILSKKEVGLLAEVALPAQIYQEYQSYLKETRKIKVVNATIHEINERIANEKSQSARADRDGLNDEQIRLERFFRRRDDILVSDQCKALLEAVEQRGQWDVEQKKRRKALSDQAKKDSKAISDAINQKLNHLGASFQIDFALTWQGQGKSSTNMIAIVNDVSVKEENAGKPADVPSVANTLSQGERSVLGFAFFLVSLESRSNLDKVTVVIDDPVSSLDDYRTRDTGRLVAKLARQVGQLIVLSHRQEFLFAVYDGLPKDFMEGTKGWEIYDGIGSSSVRTWNIDDAKTASDVDRSRLSAVLDFSNSGKGDLDALTVKIRQISEHHVKDTHPNVDFGDRATLGNMIGHKSINIPEHHLDQLKEINRATSPEIHDTPKAPIDKDDLRRIARRALNLRGINTE